MGEPGSEADQSGLLPIAWSARSRSSCCLTIQIVKRSDVAVDFEVIAAENANLSLAFENKYSNQWKRHRHARRVI
jgi:hypothetical protein